MPSRDPRDHDELELWAIRSPADPDPTPERGGQADGAGGVDSADEPEPSGVGGAPGLDAEDEADLARLGAIVRALSDDDLVADEPPPHVWEAIAARTGIAAAGPAARVDEPTVVSEVPGPFSAGPDDAGVRVLGPSGPLEAPLRAVPGAPDLAGPSDDAPRHRARRRRSPWAWALAGAAAAALVLVVVGVVVTRDGGDDETVVASARLEPLPDEPTGSATPVEARVVETSDGRRLDLSLPDGLPAPAGFYEVWLIDPDVEGMVSLGPARSDGTYAVPSDLDVTAFPIVDVSVEPPDGNPTHSGVSVLRGTLS